MIPAAHLVTDDRVLARPAFSRVAAQLLGSVTTPVALHLRGPGTSARHLLDLARELLPAARESGSVLLINDRVDVAVAAGAHGVHLGQRSLPVAEARALTGEEARIGVSVHSPEEAALAAGADFLLVGTLFPTPSHPGRPGAGPEVLGRVAAALPGVPCVGIGGITPERLEEVRVGGGHGFAVLRGVWNAPSPASALEHYLTAWSNTTSSSESA